MASSYQPGKYGTHCTEASLILFRGQFVWNAEGVVMLSVKGFAWVSGLCKVEVLSDMSTQGATVHSVQCCSLVLVTCCSSMMRDRRQISIHPSSCSCRWCSSCSIVFCLAPSARCPGAWPLLCKLMPKPDNLLPFRFPEQYTADPLHYCTWGSYFYHGILQYCHI